MRKRAHAGIITHDHETIIYISRRLVEWKGGHVSPSLTKTAESLVNYQLKRIIIQCTATPASSVKFISLSLSRHFRSAPPKSPIKMNRPAVI